MSKRLMWGLSVLMVLVIAGISYMFAVQHAEIQQLKKEDAEAKELERQTQQVAENDLPPAQPGYKWVRHGDHYHQVAIAKQTEPIVQLAAKKDKPVSQPPVTQKTYDGPLTFHAELLETNPVKALRLQQEERGHWSAKWIPPFPPDDTEAQEFAKAMYLIRYYWQTFGEKLDTPEYEEEGKAYAKASKIESQMRKTVMSYPYGARSCDLMKLTWPLLSSKHIVSDGEGNVGGHPSEYFGNPETRSQLKALGMWDY